MVEGLGMPLRIISLCSCKEKIGGYLQWKNVTVLLELFTTCLSLYLQ